MATTKVYPLFSTTPCLVIALVGLLCVRLAQAGEAELRQLQAKIEQDVLQFRGQVESRYENRCDTSNMAKCYRGNYHGCLSSLPGATCPAANDFRFKACGDSSTCSSLYDFTTSTVRYPPLTVLDGNLKSDLVESTCFSQNLHGYFIEKRRDDSEYWAKWGVESPWMHFSAATGMFRIYPGRSADRCFTYDPRVRPFYVAASSGPKNIILLLDTSGSMDGLRLEFMKEAAERVVETLGIGDRVTLIPFSTQAEVVKVDSQSLMKATKYTKGVLKEKIRNLEAVGGTNFYDAFRLAFSVMDEAVPNELIVNCNTAVLFLTDGEMTEPPDKNETEVRQYIQDGIEAMQAAIGHPVLLFTYSISQDEAVHAFPKELACGSSIVQGVWSKIVQAEDIVSSLSSYYKLFAVGLGDGINTNFVAWAEPYVFFNAKFVGTTVSAPVFDRSMDPPVLVGVVGMDLPMSALDRALNVSVGSTATFERVVQSSTAVCPKLNISTCQLESFRRLGPAGSEASCSENCSETDLVTVEEQGCANQDDFPTEVIANRNMENKDFQERACCLVNTTVPSDQCPQSPRSSTADNGSLSKVGIALIIIAVLVSGCFTAVFVSFANSSYVPNSSPQPISDLHILQPPTNPHASQATAPPASEPEYRV